MSLPVSPDRITSVENVSGTKDADGTPSLKAASVKSGSHGVMSDASVFGDLRTETSRSLPGSSSVRASSRSSRRGSGAGGRMVKSDWEVVVDDLQAEKSALESQLHGMRYRLEVQEERERETQQMLRQMSAKLDKLESSEAKGGESAWR